MRNPKTKYVQSAKKPFIYIKVGNKSSRWINYLTLDNKKTKAQNIYLDVADPKLKDRVKTLEQAGYKKGKLTSVTQTMTL